MLMLRWMMGKTRKNKIKNEMLRERADLIEARVRTDHQTW